MSSFRPKFKTTDWHRLLLKILGLQKIYNHFIVIEGINVLRIVSKKRKKNHKLHIFCNTIWFELTKRSNNKIQSLLNFDEWYNKNFCGLRGDALKTKTAAKIVKKDFSYSKKIWVSFGIDDYNICESFPKLKNAVNDSTTLDMFALSNGFKTINLQNAECSKVNLERLIQTDLCTRLNGDDLLVVSFHGHGYTGHFNDKEYGFIVPYGASDTTPGSLISMELLSLWVQMLPCRHVLLILDCCFSGMMALRGINADKEDSIRSPEEVLRRNSLYKNLCKKARIVINAGQEDESIMDGGWNNNSLLTGLIVSYGKYHETNGSVYSLFNYIADKVPTMAEQNPTLGKLPGDMGGDIFLTL